VTSSSSLSFAWVRYISNDTKNTNSLGDLKPIEIPTQNADTLSAYTAVITAATATTAALDPSSRKGKLADAVFSLKSMRSETAFFFFFFFFFMYFLLRLL
jgi:hypothetical protein